MDLELRVCGLGAGFKEHSAKDSQVSEGVGLRGSWSSGFRVQVPLRGRVKGKIRQKHGFHRVQGGLSLTGCSSESVHVEFEV